MFTKLQLILTSAFEPKKSERSKLNYQLGNKREKLKSIWLLVKLICTPKYRLSYGINLVCIMYNMGKCKLLMSFYEIVRLLI